MTVFVETDFLIAIAKDDDWLQRRAEDVLDERNVVTTPFAYLELLMVLDDHRFDCVQLFANLLDVVPVSNETEHQIVLKAASYVQEGMTPFDAFHAATAETRGLAILSSDKAYETADPERVPLEPDTDD